MKKISGFFLGVLVTLMVVGLTTTALALSGTISFSPVNIVLNNQRVASTGDNYTLSDGKTEIPYSLMYVDENGGGTTYLPVRKLSELLGIDIDWDQVTGSVLISTDAQSIPQSNIVPELSKMSYEEFKNSLVLYSEIGTKLAAPFNDYQVDDWGKPIITGSPFYHFHLTLGSDLNIATMTKEWGIFMSSPNAEQYLDKLLNDYAALAPYNSIVIHIDYNVQGGIGSELKAVSLARD